jgi:predicted nucleic acid-binding protein
VNSSPLIFLVKLGLIDVLRRGDLPVVVPDAVLDEIARYGSQDEVLRQVQVLDWLQVVPTPPIRAAVSARPLGAGESAVLAVALEQPDSEVVLDDLAARKSARALGLPFQGTLGLILVAKQVGMIPTVRQVLEQLRALGMYLSDQLVGQTLAQAGE